MQRACHGTSAPSGTAQPAGRMVTVGRIVRPHGLHGHVVVEPLTDFPDERFRVGSVLHVCAGGRSVPRVVTALRHHRNRPIIGLSGVDSIGSAEQLVKAELQVPEHELQSLPAGRFYRHDLVGSRVTTVGGQLVGVVTGVAGDSGATCLVVASERGDVLVPFAAEVCRVVDTEQHTILIDPPPGLLDLNT